LLPDLLNFIVSIVRIFRFDYFGVQIEYKGRMNGMLILGSDQKTKIAEKQRQIICLQVAAKLILASNVIYTNENIKVILFCLYIFNAEAITCCLVWALLYDQVFENGRRLYSLTCCIWITK